MPAAFDSLHFIPPKTHRARRLALAILALAPHAFGALAVTLGQDANWDLRNYHWYNAYALLNGRYDFDLLPSQTPYFYNPALDVPFYLLATHVPAIVAGYVLGFVQGLNFVLLFMLAHASLIIANPRHKVIVCTGLAALGMLGGGGIALIGTTFYDNVTSLGLFASALMVLRLCSHITPSSRAPRRSERKIFRNNIFIKFFFSGIPAGLMMGLKLPSVIFCLGLCFAILFVGGSPRRRFLASFLFGLGVLLGAAVTLGPWAWFLQTHFGNPLFPYFNEYFKSPLAPLTSARDTQFVPRNAHDFIFFPFIFTSSPYRTGEILWRDWRLPILYVLLPLAVILRLLFGRTRNTQSAIAAPLAARYLLWAAVISYLVWLVMFCIYRYAVPLEMLAPLLIVCCIGMLPLKIQTRGLLAGVILLAVALSVQPGNWQRRASWSGRFVEAKIPTLGNTKDLMIIMAGYEPYSHIVTQFPPEIPFVRIQSNFSSPNENKGINTMIRERIDSHRARGGHFMLLIPPWQKQLAPEALRYLHLKLAPSPCQSVTDRLFNDNKLDLCSVTVLAGSRQ